MIEELKKKAEDTELDFRTARSIIDNLKEQLISELKLDLSITRTAASKAEVEHHSEIEASRIFVVEEQKEKILKLGRRLASDGYNLCLKKIAKAYPEVDTEMLEHIVVLKAKSEKFEDNEDPGDPATLADP
ncbi:hypothetical protein F0562_025516 [Nyssa sinensis]|uniref:Uncharacterized protein n=1 Tax=Nyssa sinensis TaxID=561372 RepID=A0A5J5B8A0_9ASTE|nr:hypothetical protein F0562_025516 [Nyssa sinensis]